MDDDLGVRPRAKAMAECSQFGDELLEVVDLAVVVDPRRLILILQSLLSGRDVDDRQTTVSEPHTRLHVDRTRIGTAVVLHLVHPAQQRTVDARRSHGLEDSRYSAHDARASVDRSACSC